jgi:hypothetical protein
MFGLLAVGIVLRIKWWWTFPVALLGIGLMYLSMNNAYEVSKEGMPAITSGSASVMPIVGTAIAIFVLCDPNSVVRIFGSSRRKDGEK